MHRYTATARNETDDRVRRRRLTAAGQHGQQLVHAHDEDLAMLAGWFRQGRSDRGCRFRLLRDFRSFAQRVLQLPRTDLAAPDHREKLIQLRIAEPAGRIIEAECSHAGALQTLFHRLAPVRNIRFEVLAVEPLPHLGASAMTADEAELGIEPVAARTAGLGGDDLDSLTVVQHVAKGDHLPIDARAATAMPQL